jgi:hypothetical protein
MNSKNTVVATNPGQFYYHQRATSPFPSTSSFAFTLNWPKEFMPQTDGGQPIHAYVKLAGAPANSWSDWTPQSNVICWSNDLGCKSGTADGTITVNNVPAGATVWVTVHLDYALKGTQQSPDFTKKPIEYTPFKSDFLVSDQSTGAVVGAGSSSTSLLGRGKKVTVVFGTALNAMGAPLNNVWVKLQQGSAWALAQTGLDGFYIMYDGQNCTSLDGLAGGCSAGLTTWNFANGTSNVTVSIMGNGAVATGGPTYPGATTKATVTSGNTTFATYISPTPPSYTFSVTKTTAYNRDWNLTN